MSLAEFLLARIAEDEAHWRRLAANLPQVGGRMADRFNIGGFDFHPPVPVIPAKLLAECEAKRRIVERHHRVDSEEWRPDDWPPSPECAGCGFNAVEEYRTADVDECPELRLLALPYADHPDYQPAWRV
jgi:hypothetical protein